MVVSDIKGCSKTMLLSPINNESIFSNGYQSVTVIIVKIIDSGNNNVFRANVYNTDHSFFGGSQRSCHPEIRAQQDI